MIFKYTFSLFWQSIKVSMITRVNQCILKLKKNLFQMFIPQLAEYMPKYLRAHEFCFCSCKNHALRTFYKKNQDLIPWALATMLHF